MTHLRQLMLDELQRRNYSPNTVRSYLHAVEEFASTFVGLPNSLDPIMYASIRSICSATASFRHGPSLVRRRRCGSCSSRHCVGPISPMRCRFPSTPGAYQRFSARKKSLG